MAADERKKGTRARGSGIPAGGHGWGGPARGSGGDGVLRTPAEATARSLATPREVQLGNMARREANRETMMDVYRQVAFDEKQHGMARIAAAEKWLDRSEGAVARRNINLNVNDLSRLTDEQLDEELARARAAAAEGETGQTDQNESGGVVH